VKFLTFLLVILYSQISFSRNVDTVGAVAFLSLSKNLSTYTSLNFYHYDIFNFAKNNLGGKKFDSGVTNNYFQTALSYQYLPSLTLSIGHIFQKSTSENENRIFQQFVYSKRLRAAILTHRVRLEERFIEEEFKTRVRYQLGGRIPLRGDEIDSGEFYLNVYNEFYFSTTGERNAFFSDDWLFGGVGYMTKNLGSFEAGPLVQWSRINENKDTRTHYTLQAGWIYRF
jgi:hypothetical protein